MWLLIPILVLTVLILAVAGVLLVRWTIAPAYEETDDDDDTLWVEPQQWSVLERLFGRKPERLTHRPPE